jgi:hypothetical protein
LQVQEARFVATVALIKALGGSWNVADIQGAAAPALASSCQVADPDLDTLPAMSPPRGKG